MAPYEAKYYSGEKIKNIGSLSQVSKIVWLRDSIEEIEVSKKIKKIGKWLQDEENIIVGEKKIENIGSLSQVSKMVWLRDSIEGIEVKKNQKNWQEASV